jgi:hypothetical protein
MYSLAGSVAKLERITTRSGRPRLSEGERSDLVTLGWNG